MVRCTQFSSQEMHNADWRRGLEVEPVGKTLNWFGYLDFLRRILVSELAARVKTKLHRGF